jgi:hypothetical protein
VELVPYGTVKVRCIRQKRFSRMHHAIEDVEKTLCSVTFLTLDKGVGGHRMRTLIAGAHCTGPASLKFGQADDLLGFACDAHPFDP